MFVFIVKRSWIHGTCAYCLTSVLPVSCLYFMLSSLFVLYYVSHWWLHFRLLSKYLN